MTRQGLINLLLGCVLIWRAGSAVLDVPFAREYSCLELEMLSWVPPLADNGGRGGGVPCQTGWE